MTTSGSYSFSVSRDDIIRQALLNIKRLDPDESPTPAETQDCARMLNMMCKQWMGKSDFAPGLKVWTRRWGHRLLSNTAYSYTLGPAAQGWTNELLSQKSTATAVSAATAVVVSSAVGIAGGNTAAVQLDTGALFYATISSVVGTTLNLATPLPSQASAGNQVFTYAVAAQAPLVIETAVLRDDDDSDTPLSIMTVQDYSMLPDKTSLTNVGDPAAIYWESGLGTSTLYTDVGAAQDTSKHIVLAYQEPVQDFINPLDTPHYPQEWYLALCWGLSEQIAPMFSAVWNEKMEQLKNSAIAIARNKGAEVSSLYFEPGAED